MATSVTPAIIDALFAQATTALPAVDVFDGFQLSKKKGPDILMIGVDDGSIPSAATAANSNQEAATSGTPRSRQQVGFVNCWALSWTGGRSQKAARDAVYAIQAGVENILRATPSLGISPPNGQVLTIQLDAETLEQSQGPAGAEALLKFVIKFEARI